MIHYDWYFCRQCFEVAPFSFMPHRLADRVALLRRPQ